MTLHRVVDADDPRLGDFLGLTDVALRRRREPADGLFIAEGEKVIRRAVEAGYGVRAVLCEHRWADGLSDVLPSSTPVYVAEADVLEQVTGYGVHRGALAAMARQPLPAPAELLAATTGPLAVLEDVNDHTNVGAIFRGAAALGIDAVLLSPRCADPLYRRAVKVSMGAVFAIPYARFPRWPDGLRTLADADLELLALTPDPGASSLSALPPARRRRALLLGAEGPGLTRWALDAADVRVRIPMSRDVDSLNVAAAAAVAFYALTRLSGP